MSPKDKQQKKTGMFSAMRNVMPGADLPEIKEVEKIEATVMEQDGRQVRLPMEKRNAGRHRVPEDQRAVSRAHSFRPEVLQALEAYARDQHTSPSQVITQALHAMIPDVYFRGNRT